LLVRWVRASYVRELVEPIVTSRRHYYEGWLGLHREPPPRGSWVQQPPPESPEEVGYFHGAARAFSLCGNPEGRLNVTYEPPALPDCVEEARRREPAVWELRGWWEDGVKRAVKTWS
jgi:hypothetical protein